MELKSIMNVFLSFGVAFAVSYLLTPYVIRLAHKVGAIDVPKDDRRVHKKPVPRLGGIGIFVGFIVASFMFVDMSPLHMSIIAGSFIIVGIGIIDDIKPVSPKVKFSAQILAAFVVMYFGVRIEWLTNPFDKVDGMMYLGMFGIPLTLLWIVGATNTINLIDGLDGLAAGVSAIAALALTLVAVINNQSTEVVLLVALAGGALGFLPYNFNPAKVFMGDTGSLFLGFILAVISIEGVMKSATALAVAIPILAMGFPIFDTTFAIIRRAANGKSIVEADKGHLHHRLLSKGLSQKQTVLALYGISIMLGVSAVAICEVSTMEAVGVLSVVMMAIYYGMIKLRLLSLDDELE
ncbi:glycosyltransferase family 4 protein [Peptoclostridium sp.]|uniref:glycosyltransferase family 4 protein n=1 Tax=Peptoclostridium sp. TaxID=1904860 RepID=UPI0025E3DBC0|nr:MraY family glycosyltransferase [Peptoclostridium sp.]